MFLPLDELRGGDVVLTGPEKPDVVARATGGPYNHSFLFVESRHSFIFESSASGIVLTAPNLVEDTEGRIYIDYPNLAVLHHPTIAGYNTSRLGRFEELLSSLLLGRYLGYEYPPYEKLYLAINEEKRFPGLMWILRLMDRRSRKQIAEGAFCSSLICMIYDDIDLPIVGVDNEAKYISPNALINTKLVPAERGARANIRIDHQATASLQKSVMKTRAALALVSESSLALKKLAGTPWSLESYISENPATWQERSLDKKSGKEILRLWREELEQLAWLSCRQVLALFAATSVYLAKESGFAEQDIHDVLKCEILQFVTIVNAFALKKRSTVDPSELDAVLSFYVEALDRMALVGLSVDLARVAAIIPRSKQTIGYSALGDRQFQFMMVLDATDAEGAVCERSQIAKEALGKTLVSEMARSTHCGIGIEPGAIDSYFGWALPQLMSIDKFFPAN